MADEAQAATPPFAEARKMPEGVELEFSTSASDVETVFVDGMKDIVVHAGVARLTFYQVRLNSNSGIVVGAHMLALAMSADSLKIFHTQLGGMIADMSGKGIL